MTKEEFDKLKYLASKQRLEIAKRYVMSDNEKLEFNKLKSAYEIIDNSVGKSIFYMHVFLGIDFYNISKILNYTYHTTRSRYYEVKDILMS